MYKIIHTPWTTRESMDIKEEIDSLEEAKAALELHHRSIQERYPEADSFLAADGMSVETVHDEAGWPARGWCAPAAFYVRDYQGLTEIVCTAVFDDMPED